MATIYYSLSSKKNPLGQSEILMRFSHGKINQRAKTGLFVSPDYWKDGEISIPKFRLRPSDEVQEEVDNAMDIQRRLAGITANVSRSFNEYKGTVSPNWLRSIVDVRNTEEQKDLWQILDEFTNGRNLSVRRILAYKVVIRSLRRFELYKKTKNRSFLLTLDILADVYILDEFEAFLRNEVNLPNASDLYRQVEESRAPSERGQNTVTARMTILRAFLNWAETNELIDCSPFKKRRIAPAVYGTPIYISIEERNRLQRTNLSRHPGISVQRDIFIFQCLIGCRVGDLLQLKRSNFVDGVIEYIPRKTKDGHPVTVRVPLNDTAQSIVAKYADRKGSALLPFISSQKYNEAIKRAFFAAGLKRPVQVLNTVTREPEMKPLYSVASSHMARRTFIGNLYKQVKDPNLVGSLSGHVDGSRAFSRYRNIDEEMKTELVKLLE